MTTQDKRVQDIIDSAAQSAQAAIELGAAPIEAYPALCAAWYHGFLIGLSLEPEYRASLLRAIHADPFLGLLAKAEGDLEDWLVNLRSEGRVQ